MGNFQMNEEQTILREFGNLLKIKDNYPKRVITMDPFSGNSFHGIENIHILDFLTNF